MKSLHPEPDLLDRLLTGDLSAGERAAVEDHLEDCSSCRQRIDALAADANWWSEASDFLQDDPHDSEWSSQNSVAPSRFDIRQIKAWLAPTDDPQMLGRLGTYEISGIIGAGGMGVVLKGFDAALNRFVAIKVLAPHLASSAAARQRFAREAQASAAVVHEHVVAIHGVAEFGGLPYLVMPYVRGTSLQKRIDERGTLSVAELLRIGMQTASGLSAAHAQGLVHRDIKPANILLDGDTERVLLTDFGLARAADDASLTHSGVIAGTPHFMSPEQARGESIDHRSDLFSLGSVLYTAATGRPPFRAETSWGILRKVTDVDPRPVREVNSDIPDWLAGLIDRLMAKSPNARFESAEHVAVQLSDCLAHTQDPLGSPLPNVLQLSKPVAERHRWLAWQSLIAAIAVVTVALLALVSHRGADETATRFNNAPSGSAAHTIEAVHSSSDQPDQLPSWENEILNELGAISDSIDRLEAELEDAGSPRG